MIGDDMHKYIANNEMQEARCKNQDAGMKMQEAR